MTLGAGTARACITPPVGFRMGGYGARDHGCEGVHDELHGKALYLSDGQREAAVITADLLYLRAFRVERVRERVTELTGMSGDCVLVACSHTHGGPLLDNDLSELGTAHEAYLDTVCQHLAGCVAAARAAAVPAALGQARSEVRVGANRREHRADGTTVLGVDVKGATAPWVDVLLFARQDTGAPLAMLFQHAVHGTCLGGDNYQVTADVMGVAQRTIEAALPGVTALFVNGCAGNINPHPRGTFALCERHGTRLGAAAVQAAMDAEAGNAAVRLACVQSHFTLPLAEPLSRAECERLYSELEPQYAALGGQSHRNWGLARRFADVRDQLAAARRGEQAAGLPVEVQVIAMDQTALVSLPGEIFVEIGQAIVERSPFRSTLPVGYANGSIGYVPTREEVPYGGYEVLQARARWQGRFIRDDADSALIAGAGVALERAAGAVAPQAG